MNVTNNISRSLVGVNQLIPGNVFMSAGGVGTDIPAALGKSNSMVGNGISVVVAATVPVIVPLLTNVGFTVSATDWEPGGRSDCPGKSVGAG